MNPHLRRVVRGTVHAINRPIGTARFHVSARTAPRPIALEIGGLHPRPGWFVVNVNAIAPRYMDAVKPWVFEDQSMSYVYADNMIEHVPLEGARTFLAEAYRCLQPGGVIRLVTPDVRTHVDLYLRGREIVTSDLADEYRGLGVIVEHPVDIVRTPIGQFGHHAGYVYDFETLDFELQRAGFNPAIRLDVNESDHPMLRGLENLEQRTAQSFTQLVVEATR